MASFDIDLLSGVLIESALGTDLITNRPFVDPFYPDVTVPDGHSKDFCRIKSGDGALTQVYQDIALSSDYSFELEFVYYGEGEITVLINNQSGNEIDIRFSSDGLTVNGLLLSGSKRYVDGTDWVLRFVSSGDGLDIFGRLASETSMLRRYALESIAVPSSGRADGIYVETSGTPTDPGVIYLYAWRGADEAISPYDLPVAVLTSDDETLVNTIHTLSAVDSHSAVTPKSDLLYRWTIESRPPDSDALLFGHEGASATSPQNITYISRKPSTEGEGTEIWVVPVTGEPGVSYPLTLEITSPGVIEISPACDISPIAPYDITYLSTEDDIVSAIMDSNHPSYNADVSKLVRAVGGSAEVVDFYNVTLVNGYDSREQTTFFIPDVPGIYSFKLVVVDGVDQSDPAETTVIARPVLSALGEEPDGSYFWRHLPDDFYSRVENREWIETFWSTMIQVVGADLLNLWQIDANRNLSTIQPSFQKRWLGYRTWFSLDAPGEIVSRDSSGTGWLTTTGDSSGSPFGKLATTTFYAETESDIKGGDVLINGADGTAHPVLGYKHPVVTLDGAGIVCGDLITKGQSGISSAFAPLQFLITSGRATGAVAGDYLWVRGNGYRIAAVTTYELTMEEPLPEIPDIGWEIVRPRTTFSWSIPSYFESDQETDSGDVVEIVRLGTLSTVSSYGSTGSKITIEPGSYSAQDLPRRVKRRSRIPFPEGLLFVPSLGLGGQEFKHGIDYDLGPAHIEFYEPHDFPEYLFAEVSYFNNDSAVEDNFGRVVGLTVEDLAQLGVTSRYLATIRGLVFAFVKGATLENIESAVGMVVGLPFTEEDGTILEIDPTYSPGQGRILIEGESGVIRSYFYRGSIAVNPDTGVDYAVGDTVYRFRKLTTGVELLDYQNSPGWFGLLVRAGVISDPEQIFTFEIRLDANVVSDPTSLESAVRIARDLKPAYTNLRFALYTPVYDEIDVEDDTNFAIKMIVEDNPHTTPYDIGRPYGYSYNLDHHDGNGQCPFQLDMDPQDFPEVGDGWGGEDIMMLDRILDVGPRDTIDIERVFDLRKQNLPSVYGTLDSLGIPRLDAGFTLDQVNELGLPDFTHGFFWFLDTPPAAEYVQDPETGDYVASSVDPIHGLFRVFPRVDPRLDDPDLMLETPIVSEVQDLSLLANTMGYFTLPIEGTVLYYWLTVFATDTEVLIFFDGMQVESIAALSSPIRFPIAIPRNVSVGLRSTKDCTLTVKLEYPTPRFLNEPWPFITSVAYEDLGATYRIHIYGYLFNVDWGGPDVDTFASVKVGSLPPTVGYVTRGVSYISVDYNSGDHPSGDYSVVVSNPYGKSAVKNVTIP